jgi:hypothetical protein
MAKKFDVAYIVGQNYTIKPIDPIYENVQSPTMLNKENVTINKLQTLRSHFEHLKIICIASMHIFSH